MNKVSKVVMTTLPAPSLGPLPEIASDPIGHSKMALATPGLQEYQHD